MATQTTPVNNRIDWKQVFVPSLVALVLFALLTGLAYPAAITAIAGAIFPAQANGSLITRDGVTVGSSLIGQSFSDPAYFWSRLSATGPVPYNAAASSGSNYGPLNPALIGEEGAIAVRVAALRAANADAGVTDDSAIPVDLVTASASGLDPHISPAAARYQLARVAAVRGIDAAAVEALIAQFTEGRLLGIIGEARVNVLALNLALDAVYPR
ncbi:MAG: potassium-transporting ATPase subunit KdpC [Chloroflexota bacterium]|nr:potassium-transporting ATPase subunit KdpC [Chloroflexota bacterium]